MWANAQRDGRPTEYRWRPLFNAAKIWLTPTTTAPTKLCDGAEMASFASCISASRVQHILDTHSKFVLRPHHVWKYGRHPISDR